MHPLMHFIDKTQLENYLTRDLRSKKLSDQMLCYVPFQKLLLGLDHVFFYVIFQRLLLGLDPLSSNGDSTGWIVCSPYASDSYKP
jgi:hypothetical protein